MEYVDVRKDAAGMQAMLKLSKGRRSVPVIHDGDSVKIGYGGS